PPSPGEPQTPDRLTTARRIKRPRSSAFLGVPGSAADPPPAVRLRVRETEARYGAARTTTIRTGRRSPLDVTWSILGASAARRGILEAQLPLWTGRGCRGDPARDCHQSLRRSRRRSPAPRNYWDQAGHVPLAESLVPRRQLQGGDRAWVQSGIVRVELTDAGPRWDPFAVRKIGQTYH